MSAPRISVVLAVYNGLPYIEQALDGLIDQTYSDFEAIVVDDASTDGTWDCLCGYAARDSRFRLLRNPANRGVAHSRNRGLEVARGVLIACHDADDVSHPERFARQVAFLDAQPEVGLVGTQPEFIDAAGRALAHNSFPLLTSNEELQRQLPIANCFIAGSIMLRRKCLEQVGHYDQNLAPSEDYDLWMRLAEITRLANLAEPLYQYRQHAASASRRHRVVQMRHKAMALERALARRYGKTPPDILQEQVARDYLRTSMLALLDCDRLSAHTATERAVMRLPRLVQSGLVVEEVVKRSLRNIPAEEGYVPITILFDEMLPESRHLQRVRARLLSAQHMRQVFEARERGLTEQAYEHVWAGIRHNPEWLLNRGVLTLALGSLLRRLGSNNRGVSQRHDAPLDQ